MTKETKNSIITIRYKDSEKVFLEQYIAYRFPNLNLSEFIRSAVFSFIDYWEKHKISVINSIGPYLSRKIKTPIVKLDLDSQDSLNEFINRTWIIKNLGLKVDKVECYDTKHGYHVYLYLDNTLSNYDILMIETFLGSDYRKQMYGSLKLKNGTINWDVLFKEKYVINHLGHRITLSEEELNEEISVKIMNLISFGDENNSGIFKKKPHTEEGKVEHQEAIL